MCAEKGAIQLRGTDMYSGLAQIKEEGKSYGSDGQETNEPYMPSTTTWCEFPYDKAVLLDEIILSDLRMIINNEIAINGGLPNLECYLARIHHEYCMPFDCCDEEMDAEIERNKAKGI